MDFDSANQATGGHTLYTKTYINEISNCYPQIKNK